MTLRKKLVKKPQQKNQPILQGFAVNGVPIGCPVFLCAAASWLEHSQAAV